MTDPPLLGIPALLVARLRRARLIHWVQDTYPETAVLLTGHKFFGWIRPLRDVVWRGADACVALGDDMAVLMRTAGVEKNRLHIVHNWAPDGISIVKLSESARLRAEWGLTGKFVVLYFGNLGRVHDLDPVLDIAAILQREAAFQFVFVGPGPQRSALEASAKSRGLPNVRFYPAQPRERRTEILALGDVHLVTLREGCERVVFPSKLYGICAAGRPVLFIGPSGSEISKVVSTRGIGFAFARNQTTAIADALRNLRASPQVIRAVGATARDFYEQESTARHATDRWLRVLEQVEMA